MLVKSQALVLKRTPYNDTSAIVQMLTRNHGVQTFMVQGLHGKTGKSAFYMPGSLLEIVFYYQNNKNIKRIKEARNLGTYSPMMLNPLQQQVMMYCLEIIYASATEDFFDVSTFDFILDFFFKLAMAESLAIFPHLFAIEYSKFSGHGIDMNPPGQSYRLDIQGGYFYQETDYHLPLPYFTAQELNLLRNIELHIPEHAKRRILLEKLSIHVSHHVMNGKDIKSLKVLSEIN